MPSVLSLFISLAMACLRTKILVERGWAGSVRFKGGGFRERRVIEIVFSSVFEEGAGAWSEGEVEDEEGGCICGEEG